VLDLIRGIPLFSGLSPEAVTQMVATVALKSVPKGAIVMHEGDDAPSVYVVVAGALKVYLSDDEGKELVLANLGPGECFCDPSLLDGNASAVCVMATERSRVASFARSALEAWIAASPVVLLNLAKEMSHRVRELTITAKQLGLMNVYGRVASTLQSMATEEHDGKFVVPGRLTRQDIASRVGASREMVSRILKDLTVGGYLQSAAKQITISKKLPAAW
jgi:CRP/FNR family transcriptional regulator, cyclic AMP receptor protein